MQIDEFCKVFDVRHLRSVKDSGLLVVMQWTLKTESECDNDPVFLADGTVADDDGSEGSGTLKMYMLARVLWTLNASVSRGTLHIRLFCLT